MCEGHWCWFKPKRCVTGGVFPKMMVSVLKILWFWVTLEEKHCWFCPINLGLTFLRAPKKSSKFHQSISFRLDRAMYYCPVTCHIAIGSKEDLDLSRGQEAIRKIYRDIGHGHRVFHVPCAWPGMVGECHKVIWFQGRTFSPETSLIQVLVKQWSIVRLPYFANVNVWSLSHCLSRAPICWN